jgi:hypothetical protein
MELKKNKRKATTKETKELLTFIPLEYCKQFIKDILMYPLFDAAAMAVNLLEKGENCNEFTKAVIKMLKEKET